MATLVDLLAAIPTVILGLWGILVLGPFMRDTIEPALKDVLGFLPIFSGDPSAFGYLTAAVILTIMAVPIITSVTREVFETNTFGVMAVTQAIIPHFRERRAGTLVNVTSSVGIVPMPLVSVYVASKLAIEGFTESLSYELSSFGIRTKIVQPGYGPGTSFIATAARAACCVPDSSRPISISATARICPAIDRLVPSRPCG